jgi:hypothetical protein
MTVEEEDEDHERFAFIRCTFGRLGIAWLSRRSLEGPALASEATPTFDRALDFPRGRGFTYRAIGFVRRAAYPNQFRRFCTFEPG